jgi:bifunctional DNA-binding transcriptional regulator/antitoxin component of YhaV-PrlF toxin-antitoxin module
MLFDEPLLNSLQGTMATIDPYSVKKEAIDEYRMDTIEERLTRIEDKRESNFPEKEDRPKTWILPVDDDGVVTLPKDLLERSGWKEGDTLVYEVCNGGVIVRKKEPMYVIDSIVTEYNHEWQETGDGV